MINLSGLRLSPSHDFIAFAGRLCHANIHDPDCQTVQILQDAENISVTTRQYLAEMRNCAIQTIRRGVLLHPPQSIQTHKPVWTLAGSTQFPTLSDDVNDGLDALASAFEAAFGQQFHLLSAIQGNFVAAVTTAHRVLLVASYESRVHLFYRVEPDGDVIWSTNFIDLVNRPLHELDIDTLAYIAWGGNRMPYLGVETITPGEYVLITDRTKVRGKMPLPVGNRVSEYIPGMDLQTLGEHLRELLTRSVEKQAKPFDRVGVIMSGGIDSSAIARCLVDNNKDVVCYNWSSVKYPPADESEYANSVANQLGVPIRYIDIAKYRRQGAALIDPSWKFSTPNNHSLYAWWLETVQAAIEDGVDCLMTGLGGNALFGGDINIRNLFRKQPGFGIRNKVHYLLHALSLPFPMKHMLGRHDGSLFHKWRHADFFTDNARQAVERLEEDGIFLQGLSLNYDLIYPNGLSFAVPYFDLDVASFARALPDVYRALPYSGQVIDKPVLRQAFAGLLPQQVIQRTSNPQFDAILERYCINNTDVIEGILGADSELATRGVIDPAKLALVLRDQSQISRCTTTLLVSCLVELWLRSL